MTTYTVNLSNWNDVLFWFNVSETGTGHVLDLSVLPSTFTVDFDPDIGSLTLSDGVATFVVGDSSFVGSSDATLGGSTLFDFFSAVAGTGGADTLFGTDSADTFQGGDGDDWLNGLAGNDTIDGGDGKDTIEGGTGDDQIHGGSENDTLYGWTGSDLIDGGDGDDMLFGEDGDDTLSGGSGTDSLYGGFGADSISGGDDDDLIQGEEGNDTLEGGAGADTFRVSDFADFDQIDGGESSGDLDALRFISSASVAVTFTELENGSYVFADGGAASGTFANIEHLEGASGRDTLDLKALPTGVTVTFTGNFDGTITDGVTTISFAGFEKLYLTDDADVVDASAAFDGVFGDNPGLEIDAGAGDDTLIGGGGADTLLGGGGNDSIDGGYGDDSLKGGDGLDVIEGGFGNDTIDGGLGNDTLSGGNEADTIIGDLGDDSIDGGEGNDSLLGGEGADAIAGGIGNDTITGDLGAASEDVVVLMTFEDAGVTATDQSGNGLDGIYQGGASAGGVGWTGGASDTAVLLDGVDDYVEIPNDAAFQLNEGTISIRLNADGLESGTLFSRDSDMFDDGGHVKVELRDNGSLQVRLQSDSNSYTITTSNNLVSSGEWHHVSLTFGADGMQLYLDGTSVGSKSYAGGLTGNNEPWTLGADQMKSGDGVADNLQNHFKGALDEFVIHDRQLTQAEVQDISTNGATVGTGAADSIDAGAGDDVIFAGGGNDTVFGGDGDDLIIGGAGDDLLTTGLGQDTLLGGEGNDTLMNSAGDDSLVGGAGDDSIVATLGNDTLEGGDGNDTLEGGEDDDSLTGGSGDDVFIYNAGDGNDTITDFNFGNTGTLDDTDSTNNDSIDLSAFYDSVFEIHADQADDGILNQSNDGQDNADYSDNASFGSGSITFDGASANNSSFTSENTGVVCFTTGTAIRTPLGDILIEELKVGDLVTTMDNGPQRIRWIGRRKLDHTTLLNNRKLRPVLFRRGVLGAERDLLVSPQHGLLIGRNGDHFARAKHLAEKMKGVRIAHGKRRITYVHLMFDLHQVIFAENVPSESFYPGPMALQAMNRSARDELQSLFPQVATARSGKSRTVSFYGDTSRPFLQRKQLATTDGCLRLGHLQF